MASVQLRNVSKVFRVAKREEIYAITNLTLDVQDGELLALVGPSGCGKTTTLRLIAGLETPSDGTISFDTIEMNNVPPERRDVAMVFQNAGLYPHMTVFENIAFGLHLRGVAAPETETRIRSAGATLELLPLLNRKPETLSAGQRQRVAIARALVRQPKVFLFDEPLSNLDGSSRAEVRALIARVHKQLGATIVYVTHDQAEAMTLGERSVVLKDGALQQVADARTLYTQPANIFVAGFIGSPPMNLFRGRIAHRDGTFYFQENNPAGTSRGTRIEVALPAERGERLGRFAEGNVVMGLRAEDIRVAESTHETTVHVTVELVEFLGAETLVHCNSGGHKFVIRSAPDIRRRVGEQAALAFDAERAVFFNPASGSPIL